MKITIIILSFLILFQTNYSHSMIPPETNTAKYLVIKCDDLGSGNWTWFLQQIINESKWNIDLGLISSYYKRNDINTTQDKLIKSIITNNSNRIKIFNHGYNHVGEYGPPYNTSQIVTYLNYWKSFVDSYFNLPYNPIVIGAPGNRIGIPTNSDFLPIYSAMAETGFKVLFTGEATGFSNDGKADLNAFQFDGERVNSSNDFVPISLNYLENLLLDHSEIENANLAVIQIHPSEKIWNATYMESFINYAYSVSGRIPITMQDYYYNVFLPSHPRYFLLDPSNFINELNINNNTTASSTNLISTSNSNLSEINLRSKNAPQSNFNEFSLMILGIPILVIYILFMKFSKNILKKRRN